MWSPDCCCLSQLGAPGGTNERTQIQRAGWSVDDPLFAVHEQVLLAEAEQRLERATSTDQVVAADDFNEGLFEVLEGLVGGDRDPDRPMPPPPPPCPGGQSAPEFVPWALSMLPQLLVVAASEVS
eukprot:SAG22_NODE_7094_length_777_cov_1.393805_1_plen_125_part_00